MVWVAESIFKFHQSLCVHSDNDIQDELHKLYITTKKKHDYCTCSGVILILYLNWRKWIYILIWAGNLPIQFFLMALLKRHDCLQHLLFLLLLECNLLWIMFRCRHLQKNEEFCNCYFWQVDIEPFTISPSTSWDIHCPSK